MSSTNRAFIKAYRQDTADRSPAAGNAPIGTGHAAEKSTERTGRTATAVTNPAQMRAAQQQAGPKLPLSSFINQARPAEAAAEVETESILQPGTTVASFQWPKVCRTLNAQCGE